MVIFMHGVPMISNTETYKAIIIPLIKQHLPNAKIILYGSRAREDDRSGSDIDIALDNESEIDTSTMADIINVIDESILPIKFDIVDLHTVSEALKQDIKNEGVVWEK